MEEKEFYIYEHWRPDKDVCFYVGKGKGRRAWRMLGRNNHHVAILRKLAAGGMLVDVRIVFRGLSESEAFHAERQRVSLYGVSALANQTGGGDGVLLPDEATRQKMSESGKARWRNPEFREKMLKAFAEASSRPEVKAARIKARVGQKHSESTKAKMSAAAKGVKRPDLVERMAGASNPFWGKRHSAEVLERIFAKKRGVKFSEETRAKMSEAQKSRRKVENASRPSPEPKTEEKSQPRTPFRHTLGTREQMKVVAKARGVSDACREAQRKALTGRKRAPFSEETLQKMRVAAAERESRKRVQKAVRQ